MAPPESQIKVAKRLVAELEDRRVLFNPSELEIPAHCVHSIIEIRHQLTRELSLLGEHSELSQSVRAMRAARRKFLDFVQSDDDIIRYGAQPRHYANRHFNSALGELRGVFGVHLAQIAAKYGLDIEDDLASILPMEADNGPET